jgi:hypothetical protein
MLVPSYWRYISVLSSNVKKASFLIDTYILILGLSLINLYDDLIKLFCAIYHILLSVFSKHSSILSIKIAISLFNVRAKEINIP